MLNFIFARDLLSAFGLSQKKINQILTKESDNKLEELLAEEETIAECKSQNQKLLEFLCKRENMHQLIHYATRVPADPNNHDLSHKFPFVATDILSSSAKIAESFVELKEQIVPAQKPTEQQQDSSSKRIETDEDEGLSKAVQEMLQKEKQMQDGDGQVKEMLVDELNEEIDLENEDQFEAALGNHDDNGQEAEIKEQRNSFKNESQFQEEINEPVENVKQEETKGEEQQKVKGKDEDEQVNVKEDEENHINGEEKKEKFTIQVSNLFHNKSTHIMEEADQYDFTMLDELFEFLDQDVILPILCGYFHKIVQSLLGKIKHKILIYLLLHREGDIYNKLLNHLHHHSLAQLLVEILQLRVGSGQERERFDSDFDSVDKNHEEEPQTPHMNVNEQKMHDILNRKRQEVVFTLIERLSSKNKDLENSLNAHAILQEMTDNQQTFVKLVQKENIMQLIEAACDLKNENQAYAINILISIIKEFPDYERQLSQNIAQDFQQIMQTHFLDVIFSCLLVLRASDQQLGEPTDFMENQAGARHKKFGHKRLRALELIRQTLQQLSRYPEQNAFNLISNILRRQIIFGMLDIIEEYQFSSIACQQALFVLDFMKVTLQDDDIEVLKRFIRNNLENRTYFQFESGRHATSAHLATIIKMGIALKKMTHEEEEKHEESKDEEEKKDDHLQHRSLRHLNDPQWDAFCKGSLYTFEEKWTKRLEDYERHEEEEGETQEGHSQSNIVEGKTEDDSNKKDEEEKKEEVKEEDSDLSRLLENVAAQKKQPITKQRYKSMTAQEIEELEAQEIEAKKFKDDWEIKKIKDNYLDYQFWKIPEQYQIDDLLKSQQENNQ